jgi:hypothetical protein
LVQSKFGEQAHETKVIYSTLGRFKSGEVSKREALSTISETLNDHYEIKHDLMKVLNHQDAQWGPDDFEFPLLPVEPPIPQFLQPIHEPQMRFPPMSAPWKSSSQVLPAFSTPVAYDMNKSWAFGGLNGQEPPSTHIELPFVSPNFRDAIPVQLNSSACQHMPQIPPYESTLECGPAYMEQSDVPLGSQYLPPKRKLEYANTWDEEGISSDLQHRQFLETHHVEISHLDRRSESVTAISPTSTSGAYMLDTPIGQHTMNMLPPSKKRSRKSTSAQSKIEEQHAKEGPRQKSEDVTSRNTSEGNGDFIHSLCGKRFGNRSKVKKHHWGNKLDDMATTTGCWHKHRRPDISWDDHPSCQEARKPPSLRPSRTKPILAENKAPMVPTMVRGHHNILPGIPAVQDLPHAVMSPHTPSSNTEGGYLPYHTHGFPSSSPFQNLLTAVNVAAKIESPIPKGRNDSMIISNLDSQAIVAEHTEPHNPLWALSSLDQGSYLDPMRDSDHLRSSPPPRPVKGYGVQPTDYNTMKDG